MGTITKSRIALILGNMVGLVWIIWLFYLQYNQVETFIDKIYFGPYAFVDPMVLPISPILMWSIVILGIAFLPLDFVEFGAYDDYELDYDGIGESEALGKLEKRLSPKITKVIVFLQNYSLVIGLVLVVIGLILIVVPTLIYTEPTLIIIKGEEILSYWAFIRAQFLLIGMIPFWFGVFFLWKSRK